MEEKSASFAVPLMKDESHDMFLAMDGITTITFFASDASAPPTFLRQRHVCGGRESVDRWKARARQTRHATDD